MGPLPSSYENIYILVAIDYVSKWVEAITTPKNDARVVIKFLKKNIFSHFGVPQALISDGNTLLQCITEEGSGALQCQT